MQPEHRAPSPHQLFKVCPPGAGGRFAQSPHQSHRSSSHQYTPLTMLSWGQFCSSQRRGGLPREGDEEPAGLAAVARAQPCGGAETRGRGNRLRGETVGGRQALQGVERRPGTCWPAAPNLSEQWPQGAGLWRKGGWSCCTQLEL